MSKNSKAEVEERARAALEADDPDRAAAEVILGFGPEILGYLLKLLRNDADADDVFSCFCEDAWKGIGSFRRVSSFRVWAYKIAYHAALRFRRDPFRRRAVQLDSAQLRSLVAEVGSTRPSWASVAEAALEELRADLSPDEQTLLTLRVHRNFSYDTISDVMGTTPDALRQRFRLLKVKLQRLAEARGLLEKS